MPLNQKEEATELKDSNLELSNYKDIHGWLFVDKPSNISSFAVVSIIKRQLKGVKIGHGGTLDPLATGVLAIALNEATKTSDFILNCDKTYEFTIQFGNNTDTLDSDGVITTSSDYFPSQNEVIDCIKNFVGTIEQIPPKYSAIKINGKRAYDLARANIDFEIKARKVNIFYINILHYDVNLKQVKLEAKVSKGTYIRVLAQDIVNSLQSCGHICQLRRSSLALNKKTLLISDNVLYNMKLVVTKYLVSIEDMLDGISAYLLNLEEAKLLLNGNMSTIKPHQNSQKGITKAMYNNKVIALLENVGDSYKILRVLNNNRMHII